MTNNNWERGENGYDLGNITELIADEYFQGLN